MLVADVFLEFGSAPAVIDSRVAGGTPGFDAIRCLDRVEAVDDIPQTKCPTSAGRISCERARFPEVRQVAKRVA